MKSFVATTVMACLLSLGPTGSVMANDDCVFTKSMVKSVVLHKQLRELSAAHQDFSAVADQISGLQTLVVDICVKELQNGTDHHPEAFVKLCTKAASLTPSSKCDDGFIQNGWDLLAFKSGLKNFKTQLTAMALHEQDPVKKALFEKYLSQVTPLFETAKVRCHAFFHPDGCGGNCGHQ